MRRNGLLSACIALALGITACQDQGTEPSAPSASNPQFSQSATQLNRATKLLSRISDPAIDPTQFSCNPHTPVTDWFRAEVDEVRTQEPDIFTTLFINNA